MFLDRSSHHERTINWPRSCKSRAGHDGDEGQSLIVEQHFETVAKRVLKSGEKEDPSRDSLPPWKGALHY